MAHEFLRTTTEVEILARTEFTLDHWNTVVELLKGTRRYSRQEKIFRIGVQVLDRTLPLHWESLSMILGRTDFRCIGGIFTKARMQIQQIQLGKSWEIDILSTGNITSQMLSAKQYTLNDHLLTLLGGTTEAPHQKEKPYLQWNVTTKKWHAYDAETFTPLSDVDVIREVIDRSLLPSSEEILQLSPTELQKRVCVEAQKDPEEIQGRLYAYWLKNCEEGNNGLIDLPPECYSPKFGLMEDPVFSNR